MCVGREERRRVAGMRMEKWMKKQGDERAGPREGETTVVVNTCDLQTHL